VTELVFGLGFGLGVLILGTVIMVVVIRQASSIWVARSNLARELAYQQLATETTELQRRALAEQEQLRAQLSELTTRVTSMERILQQVE
jgi:hypothetical protein